MGYIIIRCFLSLFFSAFLFLVVLLCPLVAFSFFLSFSPIHNSLSHFDPSVCIVCGVIATRCVVCSLAETKICSKLIEMY